MTLASIEHAELASKEGWSQKDFLRWGHLLKVRSSDYGSFTENATQQTTYL